MGHGHSIWGKIFFQWLDKNINKFSFPFCKLANHSLLLVTLHKMYPNEHLSRPTLMLAKGNKMSALFLCLQIKRILSFSTLIWFILMAYMPEMWSYSFIRYLTVCWKWPSVSRWDDLRIILFWGILFCFRLSAPKVKLSGRNARDFYLLFSDCR